MRNLLFAVIFIAFWTSLVSAKDIYVAQSQAGANTGADCQDAHSATWFNGSANWGNGQGQIGAGTTVHLCGTFTGTLNTTELRILGSGSIGSSITILFEVGADLTSPAWSANGAIDCNGRSYITIDGGTNGKIENAANGDVLANHIVTAGINSSGGYCGNMTVKNLTISNLYIKQQSNTATYDDSIAINYFGDNSLITKNSIDHVATGIGSGNHSHHEISYNSFSYCQHCITDGSSSTLADDIKIHDNDIAGGAYLWDQSNNTYHHDSVIIMCESGLDPCVTNLLVYNNYIHGIWSEDPNSHTTAAIFLDDYATSSIRGTVFNNIIAFSSSDTGVDNGYIYLGHHSAAYNNTIFTVGGGNTCVYPFNASTDVLKNTISQSCGLGVYAPSGSGGLQADYNTYYGINTMGCGQWAGYVGAVASRLQLRFS